MKTLYLVRHAKSSWENAALKDHDRPLLSKGVDRTLLTSSWMKTNKVIPGRIISSTAVRAKETATIITRELTKDQKKVLYDERLYENNADEIINIVHEFPNILGSAMLIGHNPSISEFAHLLLKGSFVSFPTSAVMAISFDTKTWKDIKVCKAKKKFFICPKNLKQ